MNITWYSGIAAFADGTIRRLTKMEINKMNGNQYDYEVKSWPWFFEEMITGRKKHDMRDKRDRHYKTGDRMLLREFDPRTGEYTGRAAVATITYITDNVTPCAMSSAALDNDFAILSVDVASPRLYANGLLTTPPPGY